METLNVTAKYLRHSKNYKKLSWFETPKNSKSNKSKYKYSFVKAIKYYPDGNADYIYTNSNRTSSLGISYHHSIVISRRLGKALTSNYLVVND